MPTVNIEKELYDTIVRSGRDATKTVNDIVRNALDGEIPARKPK